MTKKVQNPKQAQTANLPLLDRYLRNAFENMLEGFQIIGRDWRYLYINEVAAGHGEKKAEELLGRRIAEAYPGIEQTAMFKTLERCMAEGAPAMLTNEFVYSDNHRRWFELRISPVPDGLCILSLDISERMRAEAKVQKLARTLTVLSNINQSIVRMRDLHTLFDKACRIAVEDGKFALAWIGLLDETGKKFRIAAQAGSTMGYLDKIEVPLGHPTSDCPIEMALRTGQHTICSLNREDWEDLAGCQQSACEAGFRSSASFPLYVNHEIRGTINLYSHEPDFFDRDEIRLLKELSVDIGFAIEVAEGEAERALNEEAYRKSQEKLRTVFDTMGEGVALTELVYNERGQIMDYRVLEVNPAFERITGTERGQAVGKLATQLYGLTSENVGEFWKNRRQGEPVKFDIFLEISKKWLRVSTSQPIDGRFVTVFSDITEQKQSEDALRKNELRLRHITDNMMDVIGLADAQGIYEYVSPSVRSVLGYEPHELLGRHVFEYIHPADLFRVMRTALRSLSNSQIGHAELRYRSANGEYIWLDSSGSAIRDEQGTIIGTVISSRDLTQRKRAEEATQQRVKELETLHTVSVALRTAQSLDEALPRLLDETLASLETDSGEIMLYDPAAVELVSVAARGWHKQLESVYIKPGQGISGAVFSSGRTYQSAELAHDLFVPDSLKGWIPEGWCGVGIPIRTGEEVIGVLLTSVRLPRQISPEQIKMLESLTEIGGAAIHRIRLYEETVRRLQNLQALHEVDLAIASNFDLRPTLDTVLGHAIHQLGVDAADILLLRPHLQTLEFAAGRGFRTRLQVGASVRVGESFAGRAALERRMIHLSSLAEVMRNPPFAALWRSEGFASYYCIPLIAKGEVKGVLEIYNRKSLPLKPDWMYYFETLAGQAAIAIDNTQLFENLQHANLELGVAYESTIEGWSRALDLRDQETEGHTQRVTEMTLDLAQHFKFTPSEMLSIRRGAILHDIGKMGVPDTILLKQSELTEAEQEIMRKHPQFAYDMLKPIYYLRDSLDIPYCHHEKWDGTGYPRGLSGENIPLTARIFTVVDVFDALTHDRPYRQASSNEAACEYIREQSGKYFDPQVVAVFLRKFGRNG